MEKALLLDPSRADRLTRAGTAGCAAVIVGSEFCQTQLPSTAALKKLRGVFLGRIGLATSIMTDRGLTAWKTFLKKPEVRELVSEIIVNDWGFMPSASAARIPVSAGRLLTRELAKLEPGWTKAYIKEHGIVSAETDTPELAALVKTRLGLKVSFHPASVFKAVTSYCPFEKHFKFDCAFSCREEALKLTSRELNFSLLLAEKAYFTPAPGRTAPRGAWRSVRSPLPGRNRGADSYI